MNPSAPFIQRPVATTLLIVLILLAGAAGYALLPLAALPQVELPTIQVSAALPGASAEIMATSVATPLERQFTLIQGMTEMSSSSATGATSITLQFDPSRSIDAAAQDVQSAIAAAAPMLPKTLPSPPSWEKANPADFQIMSIAVSSDALPLPELDRYADTYIAQQLSRIPGVGLIDLHGEQKPAVRVQVDANKLNGLGLSLEQVRAALGTLSVNAPKGTLDGPRKSTTIDASDQLVSATQYEDAVLAWRNGAPIHVRDVGRAIAGPQDVNSSAWLGDHRAIIVDIHKQPGSNVVQTVDAIRQALPALQRTLPGSVDLKVVNDRTQTIRASLSDVQRTLLFTVMLVVLVVFVFVHGLWSTLIPVLSIPLSIAGTLGVLAFLGYTLDNLSLMSLTIAVGFVIDDAIVVIENIIRHVEMGKPVLQAALTGAGEVAFTVVSMTVSLIAALIPLLFMGDIVGRMFREFSVTLCVALLVSALVSLTVTPMLCRMFLGLERGRRPGRLTQVLEAGYARLAAGYAKGLDQVLRRPSLALTATVGVLVATVALYIAIPKGFFPQQDTGQILGSTEARTDISFQEMSRRQLRVVRRLVTDPDVANVYSWINPSPLNQGRLVINLTPFSQRSDSALAVMDRLRRSVADISDVDVHFRTRQELQIGGRASATQFQYTLQDTDLAELTAWTPKLLAALKKLPQLDDVTTDLDAGVQHASLVIDRERAAAFGITPQMLDDTLYDAFGQRIVGTIFTQSDQYKVVLEVLPEQKSDEAGLDLLRIPSSNGALVPLSAFTHMEPAWAATQVNHESQFPAATLSFNLAKGAALGDAVDAVERLLQGAGLPPTLHGTFQGNAKAFQASNSSEPWLVAAAIVAVYIVLGMLYESFAHPITILSTLPSAGLGALVALWLMHQDLSVISVIGIILLIGIVKKNAIMMVDVAQELRHHGSSAHEAIRQACLLRFRPIMMTTGAALLGALPLALSTGAGSELRSPVGIALVGGLLVSQILTLFTTPVVYLYVDRIARAGLSRARLALQSASD
ncbi:MMPL family transporter [Ramlibacter sp. G-1-2-2]|uniref:MMPL family transporter n=1 Tax=Ramlibacter agri TaxID=2728837 RepID=A0A848HDV2_9BURK|nr:efflux RND transporter permease subunit [Ramlibacter agri]NML46713.1 MMPL family transporter [Ramlibacter agri]